MSITYSIAGMRVIHPSAKVALKNPERWVTVKGTLFLNKNGEKMSVTSRNITRDEARHPDFALDVQAGTLTLPESGAGRKPAAPIAASDLMAELAALRGEAPAVEETVPAKAARPAKD
jgi:hypothetical protein